MNGMRILQVVPSFVLGGAERLATHLTIELKLAGFDVQAISLYDPHGTDLERSLAENSIPVSFLGKHTGFDPRMFHRIHRVIRRFRPQVVHTHLHAFNYTVPATILDSPARLVHTIHSTAEREARRIGRWLPSLLFRRAVAPVAIGDEIQRSVEHVFGVSSHLIPNGIPLKMFGFAPESRHMWRSRSNFSEHDFLFVSVGRLDPVKNQGLLIEAFATGLSHYADTHLLLAGDGILRDKLRGRVEALGMTNRVHFLGNRDDIPQLLSAANAFAFASSSEAAPLSVMEAVAAGLPVIGTRVGSVPEIVLDGQNGILVPPEDIRALASAMLRIREDASLRQRMSSSASKHALRFDIRRTAQQYAKLYEQLLSVNRVFGLSSSPC